MATNLGANADIPLNSPEKPPEEADAGVPDFGMYTILGAMLLVVILLFVALGTVDDTGKYRYLAAANFSLGEDGDSEHTSRWLNYMRIDDTLQTVLLLAGIVIAGCATMQYMSGRARYVIFGAFLVAVLVAVVMRYNTIAYLGLFFWLLAAIYIATAALAGYLAYSLAAEKQWGGVITIGTLAAGFAIAGIGAVTAAINIKDEAEIIDAIGSDEASDVYLQGIIPGNAYAS